MLEFSVQEKILGELLKRKSNSLCADCSTISPTWASLDFGVFLCSNCSGAHRSLGPTITRVKSTKLDKWHQDWVTCMQVGNVELNQFWEAQLSSTISKNKKPNCTASLDEVKRHVVEKYMRKKYVTKGCEKDDPKTFYKNGKTKTPEPQPQTQPTTNTARNNSTTQPTQRKETSPAVVKTDLLFFQSVPQHQIVTPVSEPVINTAVEDDEDEFGHYTDGGSTQVAGSTPPISQQQQQQQMHSEMSFEEMMRLSQQKMNEQRQKQMQLHMHYNPHHNNLGGFNHFNPGNPTQQYSGQQPFHNHNHHNHYIQANGHKSHSLQNLYHSQQPQLVSQNAFQSNFVHSAQQNSLNFNNHGSNQNWSGWQ